jgi:hypothetical protein
MSKTKVMTREELEFQYEELLDEVYPPLRVGNISFSVSRIIKELDPIAYREGYWDYLESIGKEED